MTGESPYCAIIAGDINCRSTNWREHDIEIDECKLFESFSFYLGLHQLINEPTLYWTLINKILNRAKIPIIPPLLENNKFVMDFITKADIFNEYFIQQCTTIDTGSKLPPLLEPNVPLLTYFTISDERILSIIRSFDSNKAHG